MWCVHCGYIYVILFCTDQEILKHKDAIKKTISDASQNNDGKDHVKLYIAMMS